MLPPLGGMVVMLGVWFFFLATGGDLSIGAMSGSR